MNKTLKRFVLLFILLFLGIYGLRLAFDAVLYQSSDSPLLMVVGIGLIGLDILYYVFIYRRFYPTE